MTLIKVPFELQFWQTVAKEKYPNGLPKPYSNDLTQWPFKGDISSGADPLQVTLARMLGYHWPRQMGLGLSDSPALCPDGLDVFADADGIVCIPAVRGERPAAERLLDILRTAYGSQWSDAILHKLLTDAGGKPGTSLDDWLRDKFFEQHCKRFHHRPFIWHIWDGRKDGFSCLVNYHKLDHQRLETLTYAYLQDWITAQAAAARDGETGADLRLAAAQELQNKLKLILDGEPPYDIFVRWKPIHEQPIGWNPDLNDGVRVNIRPFVVANVLRKPPNIKWTKDRGKEPERDPEQFPVVLEERCVHRRSDQRCSPDQRPETRGTGEGRPRIRLVIDMWEPVHGHVEYYRMTIKWQDYIEERKEVMMGKPVFKGTRLTVEHVLQELGTGISSEELLANYPTLKPEHLQAAMLYAAAVVAMDESIYQ